MAKTAEIIKLNVTPDKAGVGVAEWIRVQASATGRGPKEVVAEIIREAIANPGDYEKELAHPQPKMGKHYSTALSPQEKRAFDLWRKERGNPTQGVFLNYLVEKWAENNDKPIISQ